MTSMAAEGGSDNLLKTITKLLDKAGTNPRLTPRILREKAEQRMSLQKGDLKPNREEIKKMICKWWETQRASQVDKEESTLKALIKLARVSGNIPGAVKGVKELPSNKEKIELLRERLAAKGLVFSSTPTEAEIADAEKAYNLKKVMDGIDPSLIVDSSRKRNSAESTAVSAAMVKSELKHSPPFGSHTVKQEKIDDITKAECSAAPTGSSAVANASGAAADEERAAGPPLKRTKVEYSDEEAEF